MPIIAIRPPVASGLAASVDLVMDELARRLARAHDVIAAHLEDYGAEGYII
jgi:hypothetical protein